MGIFHGDTEIASVQHGDTEIGSIYRGDSLIWEEAPEGIAAPPAGQGDTDAGYYGTVASADFIAGDTLASNIGLTAGTAYNSDTPWLQFAWDEGIVMVPQKPFRHSISWDQIHAEDAVYGDASAPVVTINGADYKVRLMRGAGQMSVDTSAYNEVIGSENEWNKLMLPIHERAPSSFIGAYGESEGYACGVYVNCPTEDWGIDFTDDVLLTHYDYGDGSRSWTQETDSTDSASRVTRGHNGVSHLYTYDSDYTYYHYGWRPLLEKL